MLKNRWSENQKYPIITRTISESLRVIILLNQDEYRELHPSINPV